MKVNTFKRETRKKFSEGISLVRRFVGPSMGPKGWNTAIGRQSTSAELTNDGRTIADAVQSEDETVQMGVDFAREAARLTELHAGDGTSATIVLLDELVKSCLNKIDKEGSFEEVDAFDIKEKIKKECEVVIAELKKLSRSVNGREEVFNVAMTSLKNKDLAELVTDIFMEIGKDGILQVEEGLFTTTHETVKGIEIPSGVVSEVYLDGAKKITFSNPQILVTHDYIRSPEELVPLVRHLIKEKINTLVVLAKDFDKTVIKSCEENFLDNVFTVVLVKGTVIDKTHQADDLAVLVGAKRASLGDSVIESLGTCRKVIITKDSALFIEGKGDTKEYVAHLEEELSKMSDGFDREVMQKRISSLSGGVSVIKVGAPSQTERENLKRRVDDVVLAVRGALKDGVVEGGGIALNRVALTLSPASVLEPVLYAVNDQLEANGVKFIPEDVVDPLPGIIAQIKHVCSIAGEIITTGSAIAIKKEKHEEPQIEG